MRFDRNRSIFAGMDDATLSAALSEAQAAYLALSTGSKAETVSYTQGDGSRSVTYTRGQIGSLTNVIRELQACLGIIESPRRAITPVF